MHQHGDRQTGWPQALALLAQDWYALLRHQLQEVAPGNANPHHVRDESAGISKTERSWIRPDTNSVAR